MKTSVALCTYNGEKFLPIQLDSILNQTKKIDEIVVCDDGSTDSTMKILENYHDKFPDIFRIYRNKENLRSVKNFEKTISLCTNEIIFLSDQDDVWLPTKVEKYIRFFEENHDISVLCSNGFGIDENGKKLDVITIWDIPKLVKDRDGFFDYFKSISLLGNIATGASMALRKSFLPSVMPFPILSRFHHDEWIALVASEKGEFELIDDKLFQYRVHDSQQVGGVFYKNDAKTKNNLLKFHQYNADVSSFSQGKRLLKRLSKAHQKNIELASILGENQKKIFVDNIDYIEKLYHSTRNSWKKKYPVRSQLLSIIDSFRKKRKLYERK